MAKTNKKLNDNKRFMSFNNAVLNLKAQIDPLIDQKLLQVTQQFSSTLSTLQHRIMVLEDIVKIKVNATEQDFKDANLSRLEKLQNFITSDQPAEEGSPLYVQLKEEEVGKEKPDTDFRDSFVIVGNKENHPALEALVKGAVTGQKLETIVQDPDNAAIQRRITVIVNKVYKNLGKLDENKTEVGA